MSKVNQGNFNTKVERELESIAMTLAIVIVSSMFGALFLLLLCGSIMDIKITQSMVLLSFTPITVIGIACRIYIEVVIRKNIELKLASSIGYNKAQMERVLKNPNYREHSGEW